MQGPLRICIFTKINERAHVSEAVSEADSRVDVGKDAGTHIEILMD
jgi:hypothetical protein